MLLSLCILAMVPSAVGVTQPEFDCPARKLAYSQAKALLPASLSAGLNAVHDALQLSSHCNVEYRPQTTAPADSPAPTSSLGTLHVSTAGSDASGDGTASHPFGSLRVARDAARSRNSAGQKVDTIAVAAGRYVLDATLTLGPADSGMSIVGEPGTIISGGVPLELQLTPARGNSWPKGTMQAALPKDSGRLYSLYEDLKDPRLGERLPWARTPNGRVEFDLQPLNLAKAKGEGSTPAGPSDAGSLYSIVSTPRRNNSIYPIWGRDFDPRDVQKGRVVGWQWHHVGGTARRFGDGASFWNGTVATSMKFGDSNKSIGENCSQGIGGVTTGGQCRAFSAFDGAEDWTSEGAHGGIAHVFHNAFWGNWQFEIGSINSTVEGGDIRFSKGGFQEGHGGSIGEQPFFIEGVREALDAKGEWWVDVKTDTLYMLPNSSATTLDVIAPRLQTLIAIRGAAEGSAVVHNISLRGLTLSHSAPTFLEPYVVPSPGDWSVHRGAALVLAGTQGVSITQCAFVRLGGNAITLTGHAWQTSISESEFFKIGDSAIVTVGDLKQNDGVSTDKYPLETRIESNHFHEIGVTGKQTAALFSATSCRSTFRNNVAYNGPRAGINLNDAFCHGHTIESNLLFNWVRETQDHGPINTWNRAAYLHVGKDGTPTNVPEWTHISANFIMNGPTIGHTSSLFPFVDNDDGSAYFSVVGNVAFYGGGKNYLGHDKHWADNLVIFPDHWAGDPCVQIWGGAEHYFVGNECVVGQTTADPIGLDSGSTGNCKVDWSNASLAPLIGHVEGNTYWTQDGAWSFGCGNATSMEHRFTMPELQAAGQAKGSVVNKASGLSVAALEAKVKTMLKLP